MAKGDQVDLRTNPGRGEGTLILRTPELFGDTVPTIVKPQTESAPQIRAQEGSALLRGGSRLADTDRDGYLLKPTATKSDFEGEYVLGVGMRMGAQF